MRIIRKNWNNNTRCQHIKNTNMKVEDLRVRLLNQNADFDLIKNLLGCEKIGLTDKTGMVEKFDLKSG